MSGEWLVHCTELADQMLIISTVYFEVLHAEQLMMESIQQSLFSLEDSIVLECVSILTGDSRAGEIKPLILSN